MQSANESGAHPERFHFIIAGSETYVQLTCDECHKMMEFASIHQIQIDHAFYNHYEDCNSYGNVNGGEHSISFVEVFSHKFKRWRWRSVIRFIKKKEKVEKKSNLVERILKPWRSLMKTSVHKRQPGTLLGRGSGGNP